MTEDTRSNTGKDGQYVRARNVPLMDVVPLRRANFMNAVSYVPEKNDGNHHFNVAMTDTQKPVYAAVFHGGEEPSEPSIQRSSIGEVSFEDFPLSRYMAPEDRKLVVKPRNWFKLMTRFAAGGIAAIFLIGSFFAWHSYARSSSGFAEAASSTAILSATNASPEKLTKEGDARINILLLGIGGTGHAGADLSDTMVLASIDPVNKTAALLSIPRDLWVKMPNQYFGSHQKINAVYSAGKYEYYRQHGKSNEKAAIQAGLTAVDTVVEQVIGVPVQYHAVVNFAAFKEAVDAVGGVSIDVKTPLVDPTMAWENGGNATLARAGVQEMDGATALRYVRSRHTSSDFARSIRQREVLVALKEKILTTGTLANPIKLQQLISTFGNNVFTDISTIDLVRLYGVVSGIDESAITSLDFVSGDNPLVRTDAVGSTSVVRPKLGFDRYSDMQTYVRSQLRDGYLAKENAGVVVAAATQSAADETKNMLRDLGYAVLPDMVYTDSRITKTTVVDLSGGLLPYTRHYLSQRFGQTLTEKLPTGLVVPDGAQFVILVGE